VSSLEKSLENALIAFKGLVRGTESDFDILRVELDQLRQEARAVINSGLELTNIPFLDEPDVEQAMPL
jgi:hypothetical protein